MRYKFKFQNLLNYKETMENFKKSEYGKALNSYYEEENVLNQIEKTRESILNNKNQDIINIGNLRMYNNYLKKIDLDIEEQKELVEVSRKQMEKSQKELVEAMKDKKVFEKLKEKDLKEFLKEEKKIEDKVIDEIVTFRTITQ
ncbi:MAG TPA: flagellar export protein FliJ [Tissierellaceae bacterium]